MAIDNTLNDKQDKSHTQDTSGKWRVQVQDLSSLVPESYDYIALTYVSAGNGAGEIETATYKTGGASGTTVATLTITYNASNEIETITRS